ncbi:photosynthetic complex assembly protein PuhC [Erythrobacter sp. YT30]|uniref:photosynthetic complex assembly protein PuhC n=1 Tax=Erythrobacter sp. YT30 TaxID=1735012 RepID=UPI00076D48EF|nr:photosynthetic complex assembly protein PuhC [Erythrobacter sp. YT30]KWV90914.1 photosynthetic complex assembly protein [Erythrobacter sp. YT30]
MIVKTYDEDDDIKVHRVPLIMACVLVISTIAMTASVSWGFFDVEAVPSEVRAEAGTKEVATRQIQFFDAEGGMVRVEDAETGAVIGEYDRGTGGFVRQTARALVHQRRIRGIGAETGFELIEWDDGALTLLDPATDKSIELASFGPDNRKIFADMLHADLPTATLSQKGAN